MEHNNNNNNKNDNILDSYESTENALMDSFKAAALKVTTLYKDSLVQNRKAYAAGYQQALQDLYEFISTTQPENGYIPVQDVLYFAREKNSQLTCEMNASASSTAISNTATNTATTTTTHNARSQQQQQQQQQPTSQQQHIEEQQQQTKSNPFSIDPHTQFTFTHDLPISQQQQQQQQPMSGLWDQAINTNDVAAAALGKRRLNHGELSFMGRSLENNWLIEPQQPAFKRTRSRHTDQQSQAAAAAAAAAATAATAAAVQFQAQNQQNQLQLQQQQQQIALQQQQLQQLQQQQQQYNQQPHP